MTRMEFVEGMEDGYRSLPDDDRNEFRKALVKLAASFSKLADAHWLQMQAMDRYLAEQKNAKGETIGSLLPEKLSRPVAFSLPEQVTVPELMVLVCEAAEDCLGELRQERQAVETLVGSDKTRYFKAIEDWTGGVPDWWKKT